MTKSSAVKKTPTALQRLDKLGLDKICEKIIEGTTLTAIAKEMKLSVQTLLNWTNKNDERSVRVREARITSARAWDDKAEQVLIDASDPFELTKARELASHYRWRTSKIAPRDYGDKVAIGGADDLPAIKQNTTITPEQAYMLAIEGKKACS